MTRTWIGDITFRRSAIYRQPEGAPGGLYDGIRDSTRQPWDCREPRMSSDLRAACARSENNEFTVRAQSRLWLNLPSMSVVGRTAVLE